MEEGIPIPLIVLFKLLIVVFSLIVILEWLGYTFKIDAATLTLSFFLLLLFIYYKWRAYMLDNTR